MSLSKLIEALNILLKYGDVEHPTHCPGCEEYGGLTICVNPSLVSEEDIQRLRELGLYAGDDDFFL